MKTVEFITGIVPILKVNNRAKNLAFFEEVLGFRTVQEENAFADLSAHGDATIVLTLEESPSMRSRQVNGPQKLAGLVYRVENPLEIEALLAKGVPYKALYRGQTGWAFSVLSPEGHDILLHSEQDDTTLTVVEEPVAFECGQSSFAGLTRLTLTAVNIRTPEPEKSRQFYQTVFGGALPVYFEEAQGDDLQTPNSETWDLSGLDIRVRNNCELSQLSAYLNQEEIAVFLDKKERLLVVEDPSCLSLSFIR